MLSTTLQLLHRSLVVLTSFLALTAIMGGSALLMGVNTPPMELLEGSLFADYFYPGLALAVIVGGSALLAVVMSAFRHRSAPQACLLAGIMVMGFEIVEVLVIGSPAGIARDLQIFYFLLGLLIAILAVAQFVGNRRLV